MIEEGEDGALEGGCQQHAGARCSATRTCIIERVAEAAAAALLHAELDKVLRQRHRGRRAACHVQARAHMISSSVETHTQHARHDSSSDDRSSRVCFCCSSALPALLLTLCRDCSSSRMRAAAAVVSSIAAFLGAGCRSAFAAAAANAARLVCTMQAAGVRGSLCFQRPLLSLCGCGWLPQGLG